MASALCSLVGNLVILIVETKFWCILEALVLLFIHLHPLLVVSMFCFYRGIGQASFCVDYCLNGLAQQKLTHNSFLSTHPLRSFITLILCSLCGSILF